MIHLHIIWLGWLSLVKKILKLILPSLKSTKKDNEYVERTINKYRVKLKNNWNDKELRFINWIIKLINSKKLLPKTHRLSIAKKYEDMFIHKTNSAIDALCDYVIRTYNRNF